MNKLTLKIDTGRNYGKPQILNCLIAIPQMKEMFYPTNGNLGVSFVSTQELKNDIVFLDYSRGIKGIIELGEMKDNFDLFDDYEGNLDIKFLSAWITNQYDTGNYKIASEIDEEQTKYWFARLDFEHVTLNQ